MTLVKYNKDRQIECVLGNLKSLPWGDSSFDIVHSRHAVEHMDGIEQPLTELIRVAKKRILIVFFVEPTEENQHKISLYDKGTFRERYRNDYSKPLIEKLLKQNIKVKNFEWKDLRVGHSKKLLIIDV